jgi:hypothetical protein
MNCSSSSVFFSSTSTIFNSTNSSSSLHQSSESTTTTTTTTTRCSVPTCTHDCAELRHQIGVLESKLDIFHLQLALKAVPRRIRRCMNRSIDPSSTPTTSKSPPPPLPIVTTPPPLAAPLREPTVASWLRDCVGLPQHEATFLQHDLTSMLVVKMLTDADLKEIGISLGHRKLLLAAIVKLNQKNNNTAQLPPTATFSNTKNDTNSDANANSNANANVNVNLSMKHDQANNWSALLDDERDLPPGEC